MQIAIINYKHSVQSSVVGPADIFRQTNDIVGSFAPQLKIEKIFVDILSPDDLKTSRTYDLIIIPSFEFKFLQEVLSKSETIVHWLQQQHKRGTELASICLGAFILARTGLLDNKPATTHWIGLDTFKTMHPEIQIVDDRIITDNGQLYTCGGAYSFTALIIYLIAKYFGHLVAIMVSKVFLIHLHEFNQHQFHILNLQRSHNHDAIHRVQDLIENNFSSKLRLDEMAQTANMAPRTFIRKFKNFTGNTPYEYVQKIKIEKAKRLLEVKDTSIEQIAFEVGYSDYSSFKKVFKKHVGLNPSHYKNIYAKHGHNMMFKK